MRKKKPYLIAAFLGVSGCIFYPFRIPNCERNLEDYIFIFLASAGIIGGINTAYLGLFGRKLREISDEIRFFIFIGGVAIFMASIYTGSKILEINFPFF